MDNTNGELFLLGAGASSEFPYYLPTWDRLKDGLFKDPPPGISEGYIEKAKRWLNDPDSKGKTIDEIMENKYNEGHDVFNFARLFISPLHPYTPFCDDQYFIYRIFENYIYDLSDFKEVFSNKFWDLHSNVLSVDFNALAGQIIQAENKP